MKSNGGDKTPINRTSDDFEGKAASNDIVEHERATSKGPGSDKLQQDKINISKVDKSGKKTPFIDFEKACWDPMSMNKGRRSKTMTSTPEVSADSNDKAGYQFEENKN